jgi:hypothetical protein
MEERLAQRQPIDLIIAKQLGEEFGISHMSIIQKAKFMGLEYRPVVRTPKKPRPERTKSELVALIEEAVGIEPTGAVQFDLGTLELIYQRLSK